jgi:hypothetical protein
VARPTAVDLTPSMNGTCEMVHGAKQREKNYATINMSNSKIHSNRCDPHEFQERLLWAAEVACEEDLPLRNIIQESLFPTDWLRPKKDEGYETGLEAGSYNFYPSVNTDTEWNTTAN